MLFSDTLHFCEDAARLYSYAVACQIDISDSGSSDASQQLQSHVERGRPPPNRYSPPCGVRGTAASAQALTT